MSEPDRLDQIDRRLLALLREDGRASIVDLARRVNLSKTPCTERVRRLERLGFIRGYRADLDAGKLGFGYKVFVQVTLEKTTTDVLTRFNAAVRAVPEIRACHMVAGGFDYLLMVRVRDMTHYRDVLGDAIGALPGVSQTHTYPVMETVRDERDLAGEVILAPSRSE
ncbi:MAG: Lrp/AsnC ligand binding domain-containing protein [Pseudomonadota bacterium]